MTIESINASATGSDLFINDNGKNTFLGSKGTVVTGRISGVGEDASVTFGDKKVAVDPALLKERQVGEEMSFLVEDSDGTSVTLKAMQQYVGVSGNDSALEGLSQTQVQRSTEEFISVLSQSDLSVDVTGDIMEDAKGVSNMSQEDLAMLRQLGIDVTNSDLSHLMGLVNQYHAQQEGRTFVTASAEVAENIANHRGNGQNAVNQGGQNAVNQAGQNAVNQAGQNAVNQGETNAISQGQLEELAPISDSSLKYMVDNELAFTYENAYRAEYSSSNLPMDNLTEEQWQKLEPQAAELLTNMGMTADGENLAAARWMISHDCDITNNNIMLYQQVQQFNKEGYPVEQYAHNQALMQEVGESAGATPIMEESKAMEAAKLVKQVTTLTNADVDLAMKQNAVLTIGSIAQAQEMLNTQANEESTRAQNTENITNTPKEINVENTTGTTSSEGTFLAYRQLQEIRLRLTLQSGYQMLRSGLDVEHLDLQQVIEELNALEEDYTNALFRDSRTDISPNAISLYQETMVMTAAIPSLPIYTLGVLVDSQQAITLANTFRQGTALAGDLYKSNPQAFYETLNGYIANYESVMTAPRSDMGDSIGKAFANIDSLLSEMGMEQSAQNRKAVKILAYNEMDMTEENINKIVTLDERLISTINELQPENILRMIREGKNPTTMNLDELQQEIQIQREDSGDTKQQRYSEFLYELDRRGDITSEERSAYIGVYRLLDRVTSYSNRDLGALVKSGQEITLDHLLTSYESRKKRGQDIVVDEEFGMLDNGEAFPESIRQQIADNINVIIELMENAEQGDDAQRQQQLLQDIKDLQQVEQQAVELTAATKMPYTPATLLAAQSLLQQGGTLYQEIADQLEKHSISREDIHRANVQLEESLLSFLDETDSQGAANALENANSQEAANALENADSQGAVNTLENADATSPISDYIDRVDYLLTQSEATITAKDLSTVKQIHTMLKMADQLSSNRQFLIPVELEQGLITMNVSIVNNGQKPSMEVQMNAAVYGEIQVQVEQEEEQVSITLRGSDEQAVEVLREHQQEFVNSVENKGIKVANVAVVSELQTPVVKQFANNAEINRSNKENEPSAISTKTFYEISKSVIAMISNLSK